MSVESLFDAVNISTQNKHQQVRKGLRHCFPLTLTLISEIFQLLCEMRQRHTVFQNSRRVRLNGGIGGERRGGEIRKNVYTKTIITCHQIILLDKVKLFAQ